MPEDNYRPSLPDGWRWVRLGEVIAEAKPGFACGARDANGVVQLRMNNVDTRGSLNWNEFIRVPADNATISEYRLEDGDIVFNNTNSVELVGKSARFRCYPEAVVYSNHFTRLRVSSDRADAGFVAAWLLSLWQVRTFENICNRWIGQSAVKNDKLLALEIPLPPLAEQKRIAAILNDQMEAVERARAAAEARLEAAKALPAAYLRAVFSSPGGLEWPRKALRDLCESDGQYGTSKRADGTTEGLPVLRMGNLFEGRLRWDNLKFIQLPKEEEEKYRLAKGDVLFNRTNSAELVGKTAVFDGLREAVFASYLIRFRLKRALAEPVFISAYVNSELGRAFIEQNMARAIGQVNINASTMHRMSIPLPSLPEQQRIAAMLNEQMASAERARKAIEEELDAINKLPAALLRRAFSGAL
jgi:type I restriction enzyme S subunit